MASDFDRQIKKAVAAFEKDLNKLLQDQQGRPAAETERKLKALARKSGVDLDSRRVKDLARGAEAGG